MRKSLVSGNLSGFEYDPEQPTLNLEKLAYLQIQMLQNLETAGMEIRQAEASDIQGLDEACEAVYEALQGQQVSGASVSYPLYSDAQAETVAVTGSQQDKISILLDSERREHPQPPSAEMDEVVGALNDLEAKFRIASGELEGKSITEMLTDNGVGGGAHTVGEALYNIGVSEPSANAFYRLTDALTSLVECVQVGLVRVGEEEQWYSILQEVKEILQLWVAQENAMQLSDGTKLLWKTGVVSD